MRPKGSPNRNSKFLLQRLKEMYGEDFEPVMAAAENAVRMQQIALESQQSMAEDEFIQRKECVNAWEKVAQYVSPKLKAVEMTGADGKDLVPPSIVIKYE